MKNKLIDDKIQFFKMTFEFFSSLISCQLFSLGVSHPFIHSRNIFEVLRSNVPLYTSPVYTSPLYTSPLHTSPVYTSPQIQFKSQWQRQLYNLLFTWYYVKEPLLFC